MCDHYCETCGNDSSEKPVIQLVFTKKVLGSDVKRYTDFRILQGYFYHKPKTVSHAEWGRILDGEWKKFKSVEEGTILENLHSFCSTKCAYEFMKKNLKG